MPTVLMVHIIQVIAMLSVVFCETDGKQWLVCTRDSRKFGSPPQSTGRYDYYCIKADCRPPGRSDSEDQSCGNEGVAGGDLTGILLISRRQESGDT